MPAEQRPGAGEYHVLPNVRDEINELKKANKKGKVSRRQLRELAKMVVADHKERQLPGR